jgi:hypothetical protein
MKEQLESMHSQFKEKIGIILSCQEYVELQLTNAVRGCFPVLPTDYSRNGFQLVELNRVSSMFPPGDLKDIIYRMNFSGALSKLLNGIIQTIFGLIE